MSEEQERADWIAAHDQTRSEILEVLDKHLPFMFCWVVENESGDPIHVATAGLCREGDIPEFVAALTHRHKHRAGHVPAGPRPGEEE